MDKESFGFFPLVFSGLLFDLDFFLDVTMVFIAFSLVASAAYVINDIKDREKDRIHEIKSFAPSLAEQFQSNQLMF